MTAFRSFRSKGLAAGAAGIALVAVAHAGESTWIQDGDGTFQDIANWSAGVPGPLDTAIFDLGTNYIVDFLSDTTNLFLKLDEGDVEFALSSDLYSAGGMVVGNGAGKVGRLILKDGFASVAGDGSQFVRVGKDAGSDGELVISVRQDFTSTETMIIGDGGDGSFVVERGGVAVTTHTIVADDIGSSGTVLVGGPDSMWTDANATLGNSGTATMNVLNGGAVLWTGLSRMGDNAGAFGNAFVAGAGSTFTCNGESFIGNVGIGSLTVSAGGAVGTTRIKLGDETSSSGTLNVTGIGSSWTDSVEVFVGNRGVGNVTISDGATAGWVAGTIGDDPGSVGSVTVDGAGSTLTTSGLLQIGRTGRGTLRIVDGGRVFAQAGSTQVADGTLDVVLGPDSVDMLTVTGNASLAGDLTVALANDFFPAMGTEINIITATTISGAFAATSAPTGVDVIQTPTRVYALIGKLGEPCPGDVNGDGTVNFGDILPILAAWGPCPGCPEDVDNTGTVDFGDILIVLAGWGPCP